MDDNPVLFAMSQALWRASGGDLEAGPEEMGKVLEAAREALADPATAAGLPKLPDGFSSWTAGLTVGYARTQVVKERQMWERVAAAAEAVVKRWDSPMWKHQEHTSVFIHALRDALVAVAGDSKVEGA